MAAAITLKVRDTGIIKPAFQMPIYPILDHRMITASSKMQGSTMWDANINARAWGLYLRNIQGDVPAYGLNKKSKKWPAQFFRCNKQKMHCHRPFAEKFGMTHLSSAN